MDPHARATTWELVRDLRDRGVTVLLTTHAMDEAEQLCDRVAIITGGRLAALGSPAELTRARGARRDLRSRPTPASTSTRSRTALGLERRRACVEERAGRVRRPRAAAPRRGSPTSRASCATRTSRSPRCRPGGDRSKRCSCRSPPKQARVSADDAAARVVAQAARRSRSLQLRRGENLHRHARDPARHPRVLRQGRRDLDRLRASRRLPRARRARRSR